MRSEERRRRLMVGLNFLLRRAKPGGEHSVLAAGLVAALTDVMILSSV